MIRLGYCAHGLKGLTLEQALTLSAQCGFTILDLNATPGSTQVTQAALRHNPAAAGRHIRTLAADLGLELHELFLVFVAVDEKGLHPEQPDPALAAQLVEAFKPLAEGTREAGFASIMLALGNNNAGLAPAEALKHAAAILNQLYDWADNLGLGLNIEPAFNSPINTPARVLELQQQVPRLSLTLDYSHFIGSGHDPANVAPLHALARHIHLKPATPTAYKVPYKDNQIDFKAIIRQLDKEQWRGVLSAETIYEVGAADPDANPIVQGILVMEEARAVLNTLQRPE